MYTGPVVQSNVPKKAEKRSNFILFLFLFSCHTQLFITVQKYWKCMCREILRILRLGGQEIICQIFLKCKEFNWYKIIHYD